MNTSEDLQLFGKHLKSLRLSKGLSQEKLAFAVELDRSYISDIERGKRNVSLVNILKLASALHIHPKELFEYK
ncbi:helix-turn-helix transcriptional regulator [Vibrio parahaemolyticus]|nr:helix-turn-helix transcriptional regulator [Vibrio parahaemolyticus]ELI5422543.1 helix-turn-helix transcriptional regulator [Vibrio parahaemolyticus]